MTQNLITQADKIWSPIVQTQWYHDVAQAFNFSPLYLTDDLSFELVQDSTPDFTAIDSTVAGTSNFSVMHSEYDFTQIKLQQYGIAEPIAHSNVIVSNARNFGLIQRSMYRCAYKLGIDFWSTINTIFTTAGNFVAGRTYDVTALSTVWSNVACTPRKDLLTLKNKMVTTTGYNADDPNWVFLLTHDHYQRVLASTDYTNYTNKDVNSFRKDANMRMSDYFETNTVILPKLKNGTFFDDLGVLVYVQAPTDTIAIPTDVNVNQSTLISAFYNITSADQPISIDVGNGVMVSEDRIFIGARQYVEDASLATFAQAFSMFKVFINKLDSLGHLDNII
jgi:hypothetical protein